MIEATMNQQELENKAMEMLLAGDDPVLEGLRNQYLNSKVKSREFTGAGFYTYYEISPGIPRVAVGNNFEFTDVIASQGSVDPAMGFWVFIRDGYLLQLEGFTFLLDEWPSDYVDITLYYAETGGPRDLKKLRAKWA